MGSKRTATLVLFTIISLLITGCTNNKSESLTQTEFLMDTVINIKIYDKQDKKILDMAIDRLKEIEDRMSGTIENSDVSKINENAGIKPVQVHEEVYYVIEKAKYFAEISQGAYEPTIGPLVELWNITGSDEKERDILPSKEQIEEKKALVDYNDLELLGDNFVYLKRKGMKLDLGGIVKGYAADEVKRIFVENGVESAIIDLGGNVYALGEKPDGDPWKIGIQDPFSVTGNYIGIINVKDKSIVTSGDYERYFMYKGERYHHIIDAQTGYPSKNEVSGISIISDKSIDGDALSTALFVLGIDEGTKLAKQLEDIDLLFITKQNEVYIQEELRDSFTLKDEELKLIINSY
ncbi:FAD:protein FMN transferase [Clostridium sp. Cult3]|uniref:FAD:protein FMN transferase n=1 Tax=Clostridium sp. Cult3 TaxID=2079004 RepID=UPI001F404706|nr:FAD:protein FMN transferase [Clostridium sp. Cult3]MCF6460598.1 thiamine biosynthesis protein ApbE [Clostridium sp. Cult3]